MTTSVTLPPTGIQLGVRCVEKTIPPICAAISVITTVTTAPDAVSLYLMGNLLAESARRTSNDHL